MLIAVNSGYWDTKVYDGVNCFKFRTKLDEAKNQIINSYNTYHIQYQGKGYILGDGASKYNLDYDKTTNLIHKISTYYALSQFGEKSEYEVMVALPLNIYSSLKSAYQEYLKTDGYVELTVSGEKKLIKINSCKAFPEGIAALYSNNPQKYKDSIIGILDIGSLTTNGCIMHNLNLIKESVFTIQTGVIILFNKIQKYLNSKMINIKEYEIPYIMNEYNLDSIINEHIEEIRQQMQKSDWGNVPILLTGGGSLLLETYLKNVFPLSFVGQHGIYDNVKGLYEVGRVAYA